jgi:hypothetical protein
LTDSEITELANEFNNSEPDVPDTPTDKEYVYTVSSAPSGHEAANGDYWKTDPPAGTHSDYDTTKWGVWTNGTYYIVFTPNYWRGWVLTNDTSVAPIDTSTGEPPASRADFAHFGDATGGEPPTDGGWNYIIVTAYAGDDSSNSSSSDTPDDSDKTYVYTVSGFSGNTEATNGDYYEVNPDNVYSTILKESGIYYNGTYYLCNVNDGWYGWCFITDITIDPVSASDKRAAVSTSAETPDKADWSQYGGSYDYKIVPYTGGDSGSGDDKQYVYTITSS